MTSSYFDGFIMTGFYNLLSQNIRHKIIDKGEWVNSSEKREVTSDQIGELLSYFREKFFITTELL